MLCCSLARCHCWGKLGKGYTEPPCIIICNLLWIYPYFKIIHFKKNLILVKSISFHFLYFSVNVHKSFWQSIDAIISYTYSCPKYLESRQVIGYFLLLCSFLFHPLPKVQPVATLSVGGKTWTEEKGIGQAEKGRETGKRKREEREKEEETPAFVIQKDKHFTTQLDCVKNTCVLIVCLQAFKTSVYLSQ